MRPGSRRPGLFPMQAMQANSRFTHTPAPHSRGGRGMDELHWMASPMDGADSDSRTGGGRRLRPEDRSRLSPLLSLVTPMQRCSELCAALADTAAVLHMQSGETGTASERANGCE